MSTAATVKRKPPAGASALSVAAQAMSEHVAGLTADLDAANRDGLAIPPYVGHAVEVLGALATAWHHNALGRPAPLAAKEALGLTNPHAYPGGEVKP